MIIPTLTRSRMAILFAVAVSSGCTTLSTPVLRHETGEATGSGNFRLMGIFEQSRLTGLVAPGSPAIGVSQGSEVFQGSLFGIRGIGGITSKFDLQADLFFTTGGSGWRLGGKYELFRFGNLAIAAMLGYGVIDGSGTVSYSTGTGPDVFVKQVLTAHVIDLSVPVSFRFSPAVAAYSGLSLFHSAVSGSADGQYVSDIMVDPGVNLGLKLNLSMMEFDVEMAWVSLHDNFTNTARLVPYFGLGAGVRFGGTSGQ